MSEKSCPICKGAAYEMQPRGLGKVKIDKPFFACTNCGANFDKSNNILHKNPADIDQISMIATGARKMAESLPEFESMGSASQALFQARMAEFGLQVWFDGYKHGLLTNAIQEEYSKRKPNSQGGENAKENQKEGNS